MDILKRILLKQAIARKIVVFLLKLHTKVYLMIGRFSCAAEGGLHPKHRLMDYHKFFVDNISENDSVLDIGCGNGALSFDIAKKAKFVRGMDINKENIDSCKNKYMSENIDYAIGDATRDLTTRCFDVVTLSNVLEHIDDRVGFLKKLSVVSTKLIIRVPMFNRDWVTLYKHELGLSYMLDPTHKIEYTMDSFKDELSRSGFKINDYVIQFGEIWAVCGKD